MYPRPLTMYSAPANSMRRPPTSLFDIRMASMTMLSGMP